MTTEEALVLLRLIGGPNSSKLIEVARKLKFDQFFRTKLMALKHSIQNSGREFTDAHRAECFAKVFNEWSSKHERMDTDCVLGERERRD